MPILTTLELSKLNRELNRRFTTLQDAMSGRKLKSNREGCKTGEHWVAPDLMKATQADASSLRMAVEDFKTILAEIKKLK